MPDELFYKVGMGRAEGKTDAERGGRGDAGTEAECSAFTRLRVMTKSRGVWGKRSPALLTFSKMVICE